MEEKELIAKLRELRQIKPSQDWAVLAKEQILGREEEHQNPAAIILSTFRMIFTKPVYVGLTATFVFVGLFGAFTFAQNSLPGDRLYSIKKITERAQAVFVSETDKPEFSLNLANKRLEELARIVGANRARNLPLAIAETQTSISEANKNLAEASNPVEIKKIVDEIEEKAQTISQTLGVAFGEVELGELRQSSDKLYLKDLISVLETNTLTEEQKEILSQMKELAEEEKYSEALILFHTEFNKPPIQEPAEEPFDGAQGEETEEEEEMKEEEIAEEEEELELEEEEETEEK